MSYHGAFGRLLTSERAGTLYINIFPRDLLLILLGFVKVDETLPFLGSHKIINTFHFNFVNQFCQSKIFIK